MVAPPSNMPPPPPDLEEYPSRPSRHFCETGSLEQGERYHPDLHNMGTTPRERCGHFYQDYEGGKRRKKQTRRTRRNKKSRIHRRKRSVRRKSHRRR